MLMTCTDCVNFYHPRIVSVAVCLSVCNTITFESLHVGKFIFHLLVHLEGIWVKFIYEGHRVKVKVTGEKV